MRDEMGGAMLDEAQLPGAGERKVEISPFHVGSAISDRHVEGPVVPLIRQPQHRAEWQARVSRRTGIVAVKSSAVRHDMSTLVVAGIRIE